MELSIDDVRDQIEREGYPYPLVRALQPLDTLSSEDWRARAQILTQLFGDVIRFVGVIALCDYLSSSSTTPETHARLQQLFQGPLSYGQWVEILRLTLRQTSQTTSGAFIPELVENYNGGKKRRAGSIAALADELIQLRNALVKHSSFNSSDYQKYQAFETGLAALLQKLAFIQDYPLITPISTQIKRGKKEHKCLSYVGHRPRQSAFACDLDIEQGHVVLLSPDRCELLDLYPFYQVLRRPDGASFYQFSALSSRHLVYDDDGQDVRDNDAGAVLRHLLSTTESTGLRRSARYLSLQDARRNNGTSATPVPDQSIVASKAPQPAPVPTAGFAADVPEAQPDSAPPAPAINAPADPPPTTPVVVVPPAAPVEPPTESTEQADHSPWYAADEARTAFLNLINPFFAQLSTDERVQTLIGNEMLEHLQRAEARIRTRLSTEFSLVVVGDFKRGKSSLINALLGTPLAGVDVSPETLTITEYGFGAAFAATAHLEDGTQLTLAPEELRADKLRHALEERTQATTAPVVVNTLGARRLVQLLIARNDEAAMRRIADTLAITYESLPGDDLRARVTELVLMARRNGHADTLLSVTQQIWPDLLTPDAERENTALTVDPELRWLGQRTQRVTVAAPIPWLKGLHLVDTPGTGLSHTHDAQIQAYLPRADAIVFVISANSPFSQSERAFLRNAIHPYDFAKVFFVVNRLDTIRRTADAERLLAGIKQQVWTIFPGAPVFGLSALNEIARQHGEELPNPAMADALNTAFDAFRAGLHESILLNRDMIQLDRAALETAKALDTFRANIDYLRSAATSTQAQRRQMIAEYSNRHSALHQQIQVRRETMREAIDALCRQTLTWIDAFLVRVSAEVLPTLTRYKAEDIQQHFPFYLTDVLRNAIDRCLDAQRPTVARLLSDARTAIGGEIVAAAGTGTIDIELVQTVGRAVFGERAWTNIDALHFVVDQGLQRMFGLTNEVILGMLALRSHQRRVDRAQLLQAYQERLQQALPELGDALRIELRSLYDDLANEIDGQLYAAAEYDINASLATLRQAESLAQHHGDTDSAAEATFRELLLSLEELQDGLRQLRPELA